MKNNNNNNHGDLVNKCFSEFFYELVQQNNQT